MRLITNLIKVHGGGGVRVIVLTMAKKEMILNFSLLIVI